MTSNEFLRVFKEQKEVIASAEAKISKTKDETIWEQSKGFNFGDKVRVTSRVDLSSGKSQITLEGFITGWEVCENTGEAYPTLHAIKKDGTEANKNVSVAYLSWYGVEKIELI